MSVIRLVKNLLHLQKTKVHFCVHNSPSLDPILNLQEIHPGHALTDPPYTLFCALLFFPLSEVQLFNILVTVIF